MSVTASDWAWGIGYSIAASVIGGGSKLAIRKSWLIVDNLHSSTSRFNSASPSAATSTSARSIGSGNGNVFMEENENDADANANTTSCTPMGDENAYRSPGMCRSDIQENQSGLSPGHVEMGSMAEEIEEHYASTEINLQIVEDRDLYPSTSKSNRIAIALRLSGMIGMTFLNPLFCVLAMNYASPSILAPFSGLTLVWIVLFSDYMIGEKPTMKQMMAACLIVVGEVIVAIWGDHTNDEGVGLDDVVESYKRPGFQLYFFCMFLWMATLLYLIIKRPTPALRRFAWGVSGGSITGFQNFLKDSLTIVKAVNETNEPYPWYFYIMVIMGMATAFGGLVFLTLCMKRYDATFSSAMFVGSFVISASIMAAVHYQTFEHLETVWNWVLYPIGLVVLMVGVKMLVTATEDQDGIEFDTSAGMGGNDGGVLDPGYINLSGDGSSGSESSSSSHDMVS